MRLLDLDTALTAEEKKLLAQYVGEWFEITENADIGYATILFNINDRRLYREGGRNFDTFLAETFPERNQPHIGRSRAYQLIKFHQIRERLSSLEIVWENLPKLEAHARPLSPLYNLPQQLLMAWNDVWTSTNGKPTKDEVQKAVNKVMRPTDPSTNVDKSGHRKASRKGKKAPRKAPTLRLTGGKDVEIDESNPAPPQDAAANDGTPPEKLAVEVRANSMDLVAHQLSEWAEDKRLVVVDDPETVLFIHPGSVSVVNGFLVLHRANGTVHLKNHTKQTELIGRLKSFRSYDFSKQANGLETANQ